MKERILINKQKGYHGFSYSYTYENLDQNIYCDEADWKLYEVKFRLFKAGTDEKDLDILIECAKNQEAQDQAEFYAEADL